MSSRSGKTLLIAVVLLVGLAGSLFSLYRFGGLNSTSESEQIVTCQVIRGPFDHILLVQGGIESSVNVDVACQVKAISPTSSSGSRGGASGATASRAVTTTRASSPSPGASASRPALAIKSGSGANTGTGANAGTGNVAKKAASPVRVASPPRAASPSRTVTPSRSASASSSSSGSSSSGGSSGGGSSSGGFGGSSSSSRTGTPILWVIEEGTRVKVGEKLVELDSSALEQQLQSQRIAVSSAKAQLISSEAAVRTAEISLQEYLEGTYQAERTAILAEIDLAKQQLVTNELKLETARRLEAKGSLQATQVQAETFAKANAQDMLSSAEARLDILERLTKEKYRVQYESNIEAAKARRESDKSILVEQETLQKDLQDQIAKCTILSPAEGIVVYNNEYSSRGESEFVVAEGTLVRERKVIIKIPDLTKMQVVASINEQNVALVAEGMAAKVKISALEKEMLGRVKKVNRYADPASFFSSSVKKFSMFVEIIDPPEGVRTGMTAETRIFAKQIPDALQISVHAIHDQDGRHFCLKKTPTGWETVEVEIGASNDSFVTLKSGLVEGDTVASNPNSHKELMQLPAKKAPSAEQTISAKYDREPT